MKEIGVDGVEEDEEVEKLERNGFRDLASLNP